LNEPDEYAPFQSDLVVYHDDYGDYSTNEPTMDGTASLIYLLAAKEASSKTTWQHGAIIRGDTTQKKLALVFTGDEYADGGQYIAKTLQQHHVKGAFFFTGRFYRNPAFQPLIQQLVKQGHYLGPHSDAHLLYCDWNKRDSLLVTREQFDKDLAQNYQAMHTFGITKEKAPFFLPPYEWYNDTIAAWATKQGCRLINFTPGTYSNADYTTPDMKNYRSSAAILNAIRAYEKKDPSGLNGFILLLHIGTHPARTDKLYHQLPALINYLHSKKYKLVSINGLLP
jgi:peptidoglycan/xylan/chitin deacetylase (PgdA/CDA1 family)